MRRAGSIAVLIAIVSAAAPAAAEGALVEVRGEGLVTYVADDGDVDRVAMSMELRGGTAWFVAIQASGPLTLGDGCEPAPSGAECGTGEKRPRVTVDLGDGDDSFNGSNLIDPGVYTARTSVNGGAGSDRIVGISAFACPKGGFGDDHIRLVDYEGRIGSSCYVQGDAGDDLFVGSDRNDYFYEGPGKDTLLGHGGADVLQGGSGADVIQGQGGEDELHPGSGADTVEGGEGDDELNIEYRPRRVDGSDKLTGGAGWDSAKYLCGGCVIRLDGVANDGLPGETDNLIVENVSIWNSDLDELPIIYGPGHDVIEGGDGPELLEVNRGNDMVVGGRGEDVLNAGPGNDEVRAADGEVDVVICGGGDDFAQVDQFDNVGGGCETIDRVKRE